MMPHRLFSATASTTPVPRTPYGPTSRIWRSLASVSEAADMTTPFKSKKMRLVYLGVHLHAANLLRHSSAITERKQAPPIPVLTRHNPCIPHPPTSKTPPDRNHLAPPPPRPPF